MPDYSTEALLDALDGAIDAEAGLRCQASSLYGGKGPGKVVRFVFNSASRLANLAASSDWLASRSKNI